MTLNSRIKTVAVSLSVAASLLSPLSAKATTISIAAAANMTVPLAAIIDAFTTDYPGYEVVATYGSSGYLESQIIGNCSGCSTPNAPGYDLFLSADVSHVNDLINNYSSLVYSYNYPTTPAKYLFYYAIGYLELYTNTVGENVSGGLPSGWAKVAIANPTNAPYGYAAQQVLANVYGVTLPSSKVDQYTDITATFNAVNNNPPNPPAEKYGFVAKSQICSNGNSTPTYIGVSHQDIAPGSGTYDPIIQGGVEINHTRDSATQTELLTFVQYLTGKNWFGGSVTPNGTSVLTDYCYGIPSNPYP